MENRERNHQLKIYLSGEEKELFNEKNEACKMQNDEPFY